MSKTANNILFLLLSTLAGIAMMWWIYRGFRFDALSQVFTQRSNYLWIGMTLICGILANVLRAYRWRMLLMATDIRISGRRAVELVFISYLVNSITPRLGELTRSLLVRRGDAAVSTRALGTVAVEKIADVGCLIVVIGLAVSLRWQHTVDLVRSLSEGLSWAVPHYTFYILAGSFVCLLIGISLPLWKHLKQFVINLWKGVTAIQRMRSPLTFAALCVGIWTCNFLQLYLLIPCFDALEGIGMADTLHLFAAAGIGVLLPTPGGAGPWHFAIVRTMTTVYHVARPIAQSYALISHGLKTLLVMLLGALGYMSYYRSAWRWWKKEAHSLQD